MVRAGTMSTARAGLQTGWWSLAMLVSRVGWLSANTKKSGRRLVSLDEGFTNFPTVGSAGSIPYCQGNGTVKYTALELDFGKGCRDVVVFTIRSIALRMSWGQTILTTCWNNKCFGIRSWSLRVASFDLARSQYRWAKLLIVLIQELARHSLLSLLVCMGGRVKLTLAFMRQGTLW